MKVYYIANVWDTDNLDIEDAEDFETELDIHSAKGEGYDEWEVNWLVEEISKYYFHNRDGWEIERTWRDGITIAVWDEDKNFIDKFKSVLEYEPSFMISKVKE
jgi:hypothetical protein